MISKNQAAAFVRRVPVVMHAMRLLFRFTQPRVTTGVLGAVFSPTGQLLIVEHVYHPVHPWGLPGGWMARRELPDQAVYREVWEETRLRVQVGALLLVHRPIERMAHLDFSYLCFSSDIDVQLSNELLSCRWCSPDEALAVPMYGFHHATVRAAVAALRQRESSLPPAVADPG